MNTGNTLTAIVALLVFVVGCIEAVIHPDRAINLFLIAIFVRMHVKNKETS